MDDRTLLARLAAALDAGERAAWVMVIGRHGSLPMSRRAKMLVMQEGGMAGTVGGGCLEAEAYARGRQLLASDAAAVDTYHLVEVEQGIEGHVCGGTVTLLTLGLGPGAAAWVGRLHERVDGRRPAVVVAAVPEAGERLETPARWLIDRQGVVAEGATALPEAVLEAAAAALDDGGARLLTTPAGRFWIEAWSPVPRVLVFGAGHCGLAIGRLAAAAGFDVVVVDDRPEMLAPARVDFASLRVTTDLTRPLDGVPVAEGDYAVIVTRGHEHDLHVLRALLGVPLAYLGMIGSRRKRALFERRLRGEGVPAEQLASLRSPMGLAIGADTPQEIAVAVVAEMIAVRRGVRPPVPAREKARG